MKGTILDYSIQNSSGLISGEDGKRYQFFNAEWKSDKAPKTNQKVDFEADDKIAKSIYLEPSKFSDMITTNSPFSWYVTALRKYATFKGRAQRAEYWYFILFNTIVSIILGSLDTVLGTSGLFVGIYLVSVFIPTFAVKVRRLHDIGKSGWWLLIGFIPLIGEIILIVWFVTDSKENNQYGINPKTVV